MQMGQGRVAGMAAKTRYKHHENRGTHPDIRGLGRHLQRGAMWVIFFVSSEWDSANEVLLHIAP